MFLRSLLLAILVRYLRPAGGVQELPPCLVRQRLHVHTSVLEAFGLPGFPREGGPPLGRAAFPWNLDINLRAPVSGCSLVSLLSEEYTRMGFSGVRLLDFSRILLLGSTVDTRSFVSLWSSWTIFLRAPCIRQSFVQWLHRLRSTEIGLSGRWCSVFSVLARQWIHARASVCGVFAEFQAFSS